MYGCGSLASPAALSLLTGIVRKHIGCQPRSTFLQEPHDILYAHTESSSDIFVSSDGRTIELHTMARRMARRCSTCMDSLDPGFLASFSTKPAKSWGQGHRRGKAWHRNQLPQPGRTALDHAKDIGGACGASKSPVLRHHRRLGRGPYALACAYSLPEEKLKGVSIVCGMGPIDIGTKGMNWSNWLTFKGLVYFPPLVRWLQNKTISTLNDLPNEKIVDLVNKQLSKPSSKWLRLNSKDTDIWTKPGFLNMLLDFYREHYKQG